MESEERRRILEFNQRKVLEHNRKNARKSAHQKLCCRGISKQYFSQLKVRAVEGLKAAGYFYDEFQEEILCLDVLPWLMEQTSNYVAQLDAFDRFPTASTGVLVMDAGLEHKSKVDEYRTMIADRRLAEEEAAKQKLEDKERRRVNRAAKRRREEIARLKATIDEVFVKKGKAEESILLNDLIDIDGYTQDTHSVGVLGGFLG